MELICIKISIHLRWSSLGEGSGWSARCNTRRRMICRSTSSSLLSLCPCCSSSLSPSTATGKLSYLWVSGYYLPISLTFEIRLVETVIIWTSGKCHIALSLGLFSLLLFDTCCITPFSCWKGHLFVLLCCCKLTNSRFYASVPAFCLVTP